jgi:hypothetical protein
MKELQKKKNTLSQLCVSIVQPSKDTKSLLKEGVWQLINSEFSNSKFQFMHHDHTNIHIFHVTVKLTHFMN